MTVEPRLLGQLEVLVDGRPVDLGHARRRCVLAELAARATAHPLDERVAAQLVLAL